LLDYLPMLGLFSVHDEERREREREMYRETQNLDAETSAYGSQKKIRALTSRSNMQQCLLMDFIVKHTYLLTELSPS
jgi:hypothetical protein